MRMSIGAVPPRVRSFNDGRGVHARRHVRRPGRQVKQRMGHMRRRERS